MMDMLALPLEILNIVFGYLELKDLFSVCSTCRYLRNAFRPDCLVTIVEKLESDPDEVEKAVAESSYLLLCHALLQTFRDFGAENSFAGLLKREASIAAIPVGSILQQYFLDFGPRDPDTLWLLDRGASLHQVPEGIDSLLAYTLFDKEIDDDEVTDRVEYLIHHGALFHEMPFEYEEFADDLASNQLFDRLQIALKHGGALHYTLPSVRHELKLAYRERGFDDLVENILEGIPNGLTILLEDQVEHSGIGPMLDELLQRGASFDNIEPGNLPQELPGYQAAAMKAVIHGGEALWTPDVSGNHPLYYLAGSGYVGLTRDAIRKGAPVDFQNSEGWTALYASACQGHHQVIRELLNAGADTTILNDLGGSPLFTAVRHNHIEVIEVLIEGGVNLNTPDKTGMTPVFLAISQGHVQCIQMLLDAGADQSATYQTWTPLFAAAYLGQREALETIIRAGHDPLAPTTTGVTPIHGAAANGHLDCVQSLFAYGVGLVTTAVSGETILHFAAEGGHIDILRWLEQKGVDLNTRTDSGKTPLLSAALSGSPDAVKWLLEHGALMVADDEGHTPLHFASKEGDLPTMEFLVVQGVEIDLPNERGLTPLGIAAGSGHVDAIQFLLQKGANPNGNGTAPLIYAINGDHRAAVGALLAAKADVETRAQNGGTALAFASWHGHLEIAKLLIEGGADVEAVGGVNCDALQAAAFEGHEEVAKLLIKSGAPVNAKGASGMSAIHHAAEHGWPAYVSLLLEHGSKIDPLTNKGRTPLHLAAQCGELDVVKLLVERNAKLETKDQAGGTPLYYAAGEGHLEVVKFLSETSEDPLQPDLFSRTPLHRAVTRGHWEVAEHLDKFQWDPSMTDGYGRTVFDWASRDNNPPEFLAKRYRGLQKPVEEFNTRQLHQSICYLSKRLLDSKRRATLIGFQELGHCMIILGNMDSAKFCFQNLVTKVDNDTGKLHQKLKCVTCPIGDGNPTGVLFVCTECADIYLCEKCVQPLLLSNNRPACENHIFLEIKEPPAILGKEVPSTVQQWLEELLCTTAAGEDLRDDPRNNATKLLVLHPSK